MDIKFKMSDWGDLVTAVSGLETSFSYFKNNWNNLNNIEKAIKENDSDNVINFELKNKLSDYGTLEHNYGKVRKFASNIGLELNGEIDKPFCNDMDDFFVAVNNLDIFKYKTTNRIGATEVVQNRYGDRGAMVFDDTVLKKQVNLSDLLGSKNVYQEQMKFQYKIWKKVNPNATFTFKEFTKASLQGYAFNYESYKLKHQKEIEEKVAKAELLASLVGGAFGKVAVKGIGFIIVGLNASSVVTGKHWASKRELDLNERVGLGFQSFFDIPGGAGILAKFIGGSGRFEGIIRKASIKGGQYNTNDKLMEQARAMAIMRAMQANELGDIKNQKKIIGSLEDFFKKRKVKGTGKEYKNYKDVEYTGRTKVNGEVRDISRRVFQRLDIDYMRIDPKTGKTNLQLMKKGRAPIWQDGTAIELHHLIQREPGSMVELPGTMHKEYYKILHGLVENGGSFRNDPVLKKQYENFRSKY
ncbi:YobL, partial [Fictibacillus macauensis ZFHKF-1]